MKKIKVGGLFSGVGGIELAFQKAGFSIIWANEIDSKACITYRNINNPKHLIEGNILDFIKTFKDNTITSKDEVEIIVAGFPCQAFSVAGYRKGFEDERGNVFFRIIDIINEHIKLFGTSP